MKILFQQWAAFESWRIWYFPSPVTCQYCERNSSKLELCQNNTYYSCRFCQTSKWKTFRLPSYFNSVLRFDVFLSNNERYFTNTSETLKPLSLSCFIAFRLTTPLILFNKCFELNRSENIKAEARQEYGLTINLHGSRAVRGFPFF